MYPIAWYIDAIKQTEIILTSIKIGTLLLSTKIGPRRLYVKGTRITKPIRHLEISKTISDTPLSKAIFAEVGTKAKKNDDNNTIAIPFHCLLSDCFIIILAFFELLIEYKALFI